MPTTIVVTPALAIVPWTEWLPDLMPDVRGCPNVVAVHELRRAAQKFMELTRAWTAVLPSVPIASSQDAEAITLSGADLVRIEEAWYDGRRIEASNATAMAGYCHDDWTLHTGTPAAVVQLTPGVVRLYPIPTDAAATGLKMRAALKPADDAIGLPRDMAVAYRDAIVCGAKYKLMLYPNAPWNNEKMAAVHMGKFQRGIDDAIMMAAAGFGTGRIRSRPKWC